MKKLVIIPGGFHPFHAGHKALYDAAVAAFPSADVYVAATADTSTRPFPFEIKEKLARLAGIPPHRFIQVKSPFRAQEITQHYDPNDTQLIFVRSEKDRGEQPQAGGIKKDGTPGYLQPYKRNGREPMNRHGYMAYLPTVQFGTGMTSATEIRGKWPSMTPEQKISLVNSLYPSTQGNDKLAAVTVKLLDAGMGAKETAEESVEEAQDRIAPAGGLGSYTPDALKRSLVRSLAEILEYLKVENYDGVFHLLYRDPVFRAKLESIKNAQNIDEDYVEEKWSEKYKRSIDCDNPKGFSQRAHCAGRKK